MAQMNAVATSGRKQSAPRRNVWKVAGLLAGGLAALVAIGVAALIFRMNYVPSDLDYATTRLSNAGAYRVSYAPRRGAIAVNQIHAWTLHVETADGAPVEGASIAVDGDMPQHGHGLPTEPQVTRDLGGGDYLVEGVKFHMHGWWVMDFTVSARGTTDTVRFNLMLK